MIKVKTNQEVEENLARLLKVGAKSCEVSYDYNSRTFTLTPAPPTQESPEDIVVGYGVFYTGRGWSPESVYVREIKFNNTFNWRFAYWEGEVYTLKEDAEERTRQRIIDFLEEWAEEENASPFWQIGGISGEKYEAPEWLESFGYDAEPYFKQGYHSGWYWKPVKKA